MINLYLLSIALIGIALSIKLWVDVRDYKRTIHKLEDSVELRGKKYLEERKKYLYVVTQLKDLRNIENDYQKLHSDYTALYYEHEKCIPFADETRQCKRCGADMRKTDKRWVCDCGSWQRKENDNEKTTE